jgi:phosphosulfolactate synthase
MNSLTLPQRILKPRHYGITSVHDVGISIGELRNILTDYHDFIDIAKLGIGTGYITPRLPEKITLYQEFGVAVHFGGTLFEKFYHHSSIDHYKSYMQAMGVHCCEVSTGILDIPLKERLAIVEDLSRDFVVLSEVGTKNDQQYMPSSQWIKEMKSLLDAGCRYVITEGRSTGTAGIYHTNGDIRSELILDMLDEVNPQKIIFEAPNPKMQAFFTNLIGANANLGNIPPRDLLFVEAQRNGLWGETFFMGEADKKPAKCKQALIDGVHRQGSEYATA